MVWERDRLLGVRPAEHGTAARPRLFAAGLLIAALPIAFVAGRMSAPLASGAAASDRNARNASIDHGAPKVEDGLPTLARARSAAAQESDRAASAAASAQLLITDALLAHPLSYDDVRLEPAESSICVGETIRVGNVSSRRVALIDTPDAGGEGIHTYSVDPGAVLTLRPRQGGLFHLSEPGSDGLLFRYSAHSCSKPEPR